MANQGMQRFERLHVDKIIKRIAEIHEYIWSSRSTLSDVGIHETPKHLSIAQARKLKYKTVSDGFTWGQEWSTAWYKLRIQIPQAFAGQRIALIFDVDGEGLIFRDDKPVQGLCFTRNEYILTNRARAGERIELFIEVGANGAFGDFKRRIFHAPHIAIADRELWDVYWDLSTLADMVECGHHTVGCGAKVQATVLPSDDTRRAQIIFALNKAVDQFDYQDTTLPSLRRSARRVRKILAPVMARRAHASAQTIACMGHAHIDVAWLWPLAETIRKCGRTFANVLDLMDRYPDFRFCQSQPHLYEFTRDTYPSLYRRIKAKVKSGQWIPTGCTWVEMDCNVVSGESLVRQVLFGTRFFKHEFDYDVACLWIPDVFGYSAAMPQILRRSGINNFLTQKISWSQFTSAPHDSFYWEGIDGSRVLAHFVPAEDYNSGLVAFQMMTAARRYKEKDRSPIQAVPYGHGDGGGGPACEHLERLIRYGDLEGMPKLRPMSPREFFNRLEKQSEELPTWVGELYLELHRGTYTTQAWNKRCNRKGELALRDAEAISAVSMAWGGSYNQERLNEAWKLLLLNQFHDILPGSSIAKVYKDSDKDYAQIHGVAKSVKESAISKLARRIDTRGDGVPVVSLNTLSWNRKDVVCLDRADMGRGRHIAVSDDGVETSVQVGHDKIARFIGGVPSFGHSVFHIRKSTSRNDPDIKASCRGIENDCVHVRFDGQGRVRSVIDKEAGRELIADGEIANRLILFEDKPVNYDAWDIDIFYNDKPLEQDGELVSIDVIEQGPVRSVVRQVRRISKSMVVQDIILHAGSPRVDFACSVDWGDEKDVLLKVAFPVNIRANTATYEVQFGSVERPTHWNTPRDFGMFEVAAQRWADLSEPDYGVALLNDCKYGHDIHGNTMRLTLLRAPKIPDKTADVNRTHLFTYSLLGHTGNHTNGVVRRAYELNVPLISTLSRSARGTLDATQSWFSVSGENVIIDTVKKAEDDDSLIVRLYECHGCRGKHVFQTSLPVKRVIEVDLMEKEEKKLSFKHGTVSLNFGPFQIRTLKLVL